MTTRFDRAQLPSSVVPGAATAAPCSCASRSPCRSSLTRLFLLLLLLCADLVLRLQVKVQIIQTLSILVQNISNEVSIFYLLSNNYIKSHKHKHNAADAAAHGLIAPKGRAFSPDSLSCVDSSSDMIVHRFDFADEEIVTYYINFLKVGGLE